jgi:hypothetical protein
MRVQNEGTGKSSWWMLNPDAKPGNGMFIFDFIYVIMFKLFTLEIKYKCLSYDFELCVSQSLKRPI